MRPYGRKKSIVMRGRGNWPASHVTSARDGGGGEGQSGRTKVGREGYSTSRQAWTTQLTSAPSSVTPRHASS